jgi:hypothetical protein
VQDERISKLESQLLAKAAATAAAAASLETESTRRQARGEDGKGEEEERERERGRERAQQDDVRARERAIAALREEERALEGQLLDEEGWQREAGMHVGEGAPPASNASDASPADRHASFVRAYGREGERLGGEERGARALEKGHGGGVEVGGGAGVGRGEPRAGVEVGLTREGKRAWELEGVRARLRERREMEKRDRVREERDGRDERASTSGRGHDAVAEGERDEGRREPYGETERAEGEGGQEVARESEDDGDVSVEEFGEDYLLDLLQDPGHPQVPCLSPLPPLLPPQIEVPYA